MNLAPFGQIRLENEQRLRKKAFLILRRPEAWISASPAFITADGKRIFIRAAPEPGLENLTSGSISPKEHPRKTLVTAIRAGFGSLQTSMFARSPLVRRTFWFSGRTRTCV